MSNPEQKKSDEVADDIVLPLRNPNIKMVTRSVQWGWKKVTVEKKGELYYIIQKKEVHLKNELNSDVQKQ